MDKFLALIRQDTREAPENQRPFNNKAFSNFFGSTLRHHWSQGLSAYEKVIPLSEGQFQFHIDGPRFNVVHFSGNAKYGLFLKWRGKQIGPHPP